MIRCRACGHANDGTREFCNSCGQFLEWTGERGEDAAERDDGVFFSTDHTVATDGFVQPAPGLDLTPPPPPPSPPMPGHLDEHGDDPDPEVLVLPEPPSGADDAPPPPPTELPGGGLPPPSSLGEEPSEWRPPSSVVRAQAPDADALARIVKRPSADRSQRRAAASLLAPHRVRRPAGVEISLGTGAKDTAVEQRAVSEEVEPLGPVLPGVQRSFSDAESTSRQPPSRAPKTGDVYCVSCGEVNLPSRSFCRRCGLDMPVGVAAMSAPDPTWFERLFDGWFSRRHARAERRYRAGERPAEAAKVTGESRGRLLWRSIRKVARISFGYLVTLLAILALVGTVLPQAQPIREDLVSRLEAAGQRFNNFLIPQFVLVNPIGVMASSEQEANPAEQIADGFSNRYWSEGSPGNGTGEWVEFTFEEPVELQRIAVLNGGVMRGEEFISQPRPRELQLTFDDGSTEQLELRDERELQELRIDTPPTTTIRIDILSVYPSRLGGTDASITEIEFLRRLR